MQVGVEHDDAERQDEGRVGRREDRGVLIKTKRAGTHKRTHKRVRLHGVAS